MRLTLSSTACVLGTVPIVVININYLIAASEGYVPWCVPYWDSCTSISATGREGSAFYFFKLTMLPLAMVYLWYWRLAQQTLAAAGYHGQAIRTLGYCAVLALIVYVLALGLAGDSFQLVRRIGIIFYFTFTYLSSLLIIYQLYQIPLPLRGRSGQLVLSSLILIIGLITVLLDFVLDNYDDYEDAFEWNLALLLHLNFLLAWWGWRAAPVTAGKTNKTL